MQYRRVGHTGLKVSAVSIGGWLTYGGSVEEARSVRVLRHAVAHGINFIDLADIYAHGRAEEVTRRAIDGLRRDHLVISSKVYWPMSESPNDRGLSRKHIFESVHASLKRLGTDYLDIYFCHRYDDETPLEETVRAMDDLVRQGKVLYWGTSVWTPSQIRAAHEVAGAMGAYKPVVEQPRYNLIDREIERDVLPTCVELGMGVVVWSPLAQGMLTGKYGAGERPAGSRGASSQWLDRVLTEKNIARVAKLRELAQSMGVTPGQLALSWLLDHGAVSSVITGATSEAQVTENLGAVEVKMAPSLRAELDELFG